MHSQTLAMTKAQMGSNHRVTVEACGLSDVGRERKVNEDTYLVADLERVMRFRETNLPSTEQERLAGDSFGTLLVVADGMGGQGDGDVASRTAVTAVVSYLLNVLPWVAGHSRYDADPQSSIPGVRRELASALSVGDQFVKNAAKQGGRSPGMGTTLTIAYVAWPSLYVAHVGDSRCYLYRDAALHQLTTDHTVAQQLIESGAQAEIGPDSPYRHLLWNALGGGQDIDPRPQLLKIQLQPDDVILLCSDGLTTYIADEELRTALGSANSHAELCRHLVARANAEGGSDNITALVARVVVADGPASRTGRIDGDHQS